jgi:hypothetical protein
MLNRMFFENQNIINPLFLPGLVVVLFALKYNLDFLKGLLVSKIPLDKEIPGDKTKGPQ